jgi:hypothetical protein
MRLVLSSALLGLAWFAVAAVVTSAAAWVIARAIGRTGRSLDATSVLAVRLFPASASLLFVFAIFLPAHWRLEPEQTDESFGLVLGVCALAGCTILLRSLWRAGRAAWSGCRFAQLTAGSPRQLDAEAFEVGALPGVSLAGIVRPRIMIGSEALAALTRSELEMAISHEVAHRQSRDNLKRFLMFCAPDVFGWTSAGRRLEELWEAASECQADDRAVMGDRTRAVLLASALIKVARISGRRGAPPLATPALSAFNVPSLIETRVRRLVAETVARPASRLPVGQSWLVAAALLPAGAWALGLSSGLHAFTETMVRFLP